MENALQCTDTVTLDTRCPACIHLPTEGLVPPAAWRAVDLLLASSHCEAWASTLSAFDVDHKRVMSPLKD